MSTPVSDVQQRLENLDPSDENYLPVLRELLNHQGLRPHVQGLDESGLERFIEILDRTLNHVPFTDDLFRKALRGLQSICSNRGVLPQSYIIQGGRISKKGDPIASGGFVDAHEAELDGKRVCVKALRLYIQDTAGVTKKVFYKEVIVWKRLQHPNIVPFLGVPAKIPPFEIVCDWMENGTITEYVRKHPDADRAYLLWDVADGLHYLHLCNVIHGDLKEANILIDEGGRARLTDFGLGSIVRGEYSITTSQELNITSKTTWAAPEILGGGPVSKEGDVFTFAMVAVEAFTGHAPFAVNYNTAIFYILNGNRPGRPQTLHHDRLWEVITRSWSKTPSERPTAFELLEFFRESFPRKNDAPEVQPLPTTSSTWSLADTEEHADENTEPHPESPGQVTPGEGESRSQGPSTVNTRADGYEPRADTDNPNQLAPEEPLPSTSSARSLVEPQGPPKPPPIPPTAPIFGAKLRSHTPPEELRLRTSFSPQPRQGLPEGDGRRVSVPHVGVSARDPHILTAGPSRLENNRAASSSPLRQLRNVWRTPSSTVISMVQGNTKRDGRVYTQQAAHTSDTEVRRRNPMLRALQSCCCCRCPCI